MTSPSNDDDIDFEADLEAALDAGGKQAPVVEQDDEQETEAEEHARYVREGRRFVKEQAEEDKSAAKAPKEGEQQQQAAAAPKPWRPTWYKDEYGPWDQLSEPFRNALRDQERNAAQAIEKHSTAAKSWDPINQAIAPFEQQLRAQGQTPQQFVSGLLNIYGYLQQDPVKALDWLAQNTLGQGWTIQELARWMDEQGHQGHRIDPVKQELEQLRSQVQQLSQLPQQQRREAAQLQISEWAKDKPDFEALRPLMASLANQNPQASLDALYEQARWAHPEIRQRILQEQEDKRRAELKGKRQAGAQSPRGVPSDGAQRRPKQNGQWNIEGDIAEVLDELGIT